MDALPYTKNEADEYEKLGDIVSRLKLRLRSYLVILQSNKATVENLYIFHVNKKQQITAPFDCCSIPCREFK